MKNKEKAQEIATERAILLAPLLSHDLDKGQIRMLKERICRENGLSERTLTAYTCFPQSPKSKSHSTSP